MAGGGKAEGSFAARLTEGRDATGPFLFLARRRSSKPGRDVPAKLTLGFGVLKRLLPSLLSSQDRSVPARLQVRNHKQGPGPHA